MLNTFIVQTSTGTKRISTNAPREQLERYASERFGPISVSEQPEGLDAENHGGYTTEHQDAERFDGMS